MLFKYSLKNEIGIDNKSSSNITYVLERCSLLEIPLGDSEKKSAENRRLNEKY